MDHWQQIAEERLLDNEISFAAARSSGPGGQNVNKVNTKVELRFDITASAVLSDEEKEILLATLRKKITTEGVLVLTSQTERSQLKNKEVVVAKFYQLITKTLTPLKKRIPTGVPTGVKEKRLEEKQKRAEKKVLRKPPEV